MREAARVGTDAASWDVARAGKADTGAGSGSSALRGGASIVGLRSRAAWAARPRFYLAARLQSSSPPGGAKE
jgi:hypothetical protein